jgi:ABC-type transport system involved in multi-copper enzyme maturation permease subunit
MFVVPVIYSLDIFSGEMSNKTIHLLFKIPVERSKIFFSKYLVSIVGMAIVFAATSMVMEVMGHGREMPVYFLMKINFLCGGSGIALFTWFTIFGCQSRSEAASLAIMFAVFIGWGIVFLWSSVCEVEWAYSFVPYWLIVGTNIEFDFVRAIVCQFIVDLCVVSIACYRFSSIRRYL